MKLKTLFLAAAVLACSAPAVAKPLTLTFEDLDPASAHDVPIDTQYQAAHGITFSGEVVAAYPHDEAKDRVIMWVYGSANEPGNRAYADLNVPTGFTGGVTLTYKNIGQIDEGVYGYSDVDEKGDLIAGGTFYTVGEVGDDWQILHLDFGTFSAKSLAFAGYNGAIEIDSITFDIDPSPATPAVPEPASWALMLGGFGLVGGAMRAGRRRSVKVAMA